MPARASARAHAMLPVTSSSNRRRSKRNDAPNSNAARSGAVSKRPDHSVVPSRRSSVVDRESSVISRERPPSMCFCRDDAETLRSRFRLDGLAADDPRVALEELEADVAAHPLLDFVDVRVERVAQRREPRAAIDELGVLTADAAREARDVTRCDELLQLGVRGV